jgi:hypothetical protein
VSLVPLDGHMTWGVEIFCSKSWRMPVQNLRGEWGENGAAENDVGGRCQSQEMPSFRINGGEEKKHGVCLTSDAVEPAIWHSSGIVASCLGVPNLRIRTNYDVVRLGKRCANAGSSDLGES